MVLSGVFDALFSFKDITGATPLEKITKLGIVHKFFDTKFRNLPS